MPITLSASRVLRALSLLITVLLLLSLAATLWEVSGRGNLGGIVGFFDVNDERSIPTWYSSLGLLPASALLAIVARRECEAGSRDRWAWALLAAVFLLLSADEIAGFHETLRRVVSHKAKLSGYFKHALLLAGAAFAAPLALLQWGFMRRLPSRRRYQFLVSGIVFVGGAVGVEILAGKVFHRTGDTRALSYVLLYHVEEAMEMFGVALFVSALIEQLGTTLGKDAFSLRFDPD